MIKITESEFWVPMKQNEPQISYPILFKLMISKVMKTKALS